jgi:hypothetical protein
VALGRKNWLFASSDSGGERAAAIYSLIETAKLNGLDPATCLSVSPIIPSTVWPSCCPGISVASLAASPPELSNHQARHATVVSGRLPEIGRLILAKWPPLGLFQALTFGGVY